MEKMYLFENEHKIREYDSAPLRFYVGKTLIRQIFAPTEKDLSEFGYKKLVLSEKPEFNEETQYLTEKYVDGDVITKAYEIVNIEYGNEEEN